MDSQSIGMDTLSTLNDFYTPLHVSLRVWLVCVSVHIVPEWIIIWPWEKGMTHTVVAQTYQRRFKWHFRSGIGDFSMYLFRSEKKNWKVIEARQNSLNTATENRPQSFWSIFGRDSWVIPRSRKLSRASAWKIVESNDIIMQLPSSFLHCWDRIVPRRKIACRNIRVFAKTETFYIFRRKIHKLFVRNKNPSRMAEWRMERIWRFFAVWFFWLRKDCGQTDCGKLCARPDWGVDFEFRTAVASPMAALR